MISNLLELSRIQAKKENFDDVDCNEIIVDVLENLHAEILESNATIIYDPLPKLHGDATQLLSLFQNLINNAIKFHREGVIPEVRVTAALNESEWVFGVKDNGIGIDPRNFKRLFLAFQRLETQHEYAGTGIGLATCKRIVERHGGRIWVESVPNRGPLSFFLSHF